MGVNLADIIKARDVTSEELRGKTVAIDAYNAIYQFLSVIRQPDGTPLKDSRGRITSHLSGLLNRNANLIEMGVRPAYVFDGIPSEMKSGTIQDRHERRVKAQQEWQTSIEKGETEKAFSKATQSSRITNEIVASSRILLTHLGIPVVQAAEEGEAQAAYMAQKGVVWAASSQDFDSLLFGAPRLLRNLTLAGRRKMPGRNEYRDVKMEIIDAEMAFRELEISREQLIDLCIMMGTDYNEGISGIGPKRALKLIKEQGDFVRAMASIDKVFPEYEKVRDLFLDFEKTDNYTLDWKEPDRTKVVEMLVGQYDFSEQRVNSALDKMVPKPVKKEIKNQSSLDMF
ncbi:MAG TPA: flap endonuclease-1 [Methanomassiliicoccales archaeon]|jgi:flap endonuclease-1